MSTPPAPTDEEMIAWLEGQADESEVCMHEAIAGGLGDTDLMRSEAAMLRAIAARLRAPSAGKSEPQTPWQGEDGR